MSLRAAARKAARAAVGDRRYTRLILACARLLAAIDESAPGAVQPVAEHAREWVDRCHKRLRDRADEPILEEALHEVRLTAKKLRYSVDFFGDVVREAKRKRAVRYGDALARLQDVLGVINDAAVARRLLGALIGRGPIDPQTIAVLRGWLAGGEAVERVPLQGTLDAWRRCPPFWRSG